MGKMAQLFHTIQTAFSTKKEVEIQHPLSSYFDKKYKTIICRKLSDNDQEIIEWINKNSNGMVSVRVLSGRSVSDGIGWYPHPVGPITRMCLGFEDPDDALFFKIKYSI